MHTLSLGQASIDSARLMHTLCGLLHTWMTVLQTFQNQFAHDDNQETNKITHHSAVQRVGSGQSLAEATFLSLFQAFLLVIVARALITDMRQLIGCKREQQNSKARKQNETHGNSYNQKAVQAAQESSGVIWKKSPECLSRNLYLQLGENGV
jgi:hypothetical protein